MIDTALPPPPDPVWDRYRALLVGEAALPPGDWTFKRNPVYQQFLEHVGQGEGQRYLELLKRSAYWDSDVEAALIEAAQDNDSLGCPITVPSSLGIDCSPTNLRYAWQAFTLWEHVRSFGLRRVAVLELGGGYGGLALFAQRLAPFFAVGVSSYTVVDVSEAGSLQQTFCKELDVPVRVVNGEDERAIEHAVSTTHPDGRVFVSCYGFSELREDIRVWYRERLASRCPYGFLMWNRTEPYSLYEGVPLTILDDPVPLEAGTKVVLY